MKNRGGSKYSALLFLAAFVVALIFSAPQVRSTQDESSYPPAEVPQRSDIGPVKVSDPVVVKGLTALARWDLAAADDIADQLKREGRFSEPETLFFRAWLEYFHGDYAASLKILKELNLQAKSVNIGQLIDRVEKLTRVMGEVQSFESEHFVIRVVPGVDEVLISDAIDTLERAYDVFTVDLDVRPTSKVVLEVFPTFEAFEWATGLTEKDVETTGTVAVCKFARLMITTPRALLRGYAWRDTVSHEFVHYLIFLRAGYNCPIWLHEGIAKYQEKRWRMPEGGWLSPSSQSILAAAIKADSLIPFEEMEPSFAKLPSARAGQLAFAEVTMCVKYMVQRDGFDLILKLLDRLDANSNWRKAVTAEMGEPFDTFMKKWKGFLKTSDFIEIKGIDIEGVKIRKGEAEEGDEDVEEATPAKGKDDSGQRYSRLGDLLRGQGRTKAAVVEYRKALESSPNSLYLLNRTAQMLMKQGDLDAAIPLLEKAEQLYPDYYPATFKRLGVIYMVKKDWTKAKPCLEQSVNLNPYDPEVQSLLFEVYSKLGLEKEKKLTERKLNILVQNSINLGRTAR